MAKQTDGINGGFRGKVGNAVGYMWRGQWCVRAKPQQFHDAKTEKQLEQRALFKASVDFAGRLKEILRVGFHCPALAVHKTECNYFLMVNKLCLTWAPTPQSSGQPPSGRGAAEEKRSGQPQAMDGLLAVDYESLRVSEGPVAPVAFHLPLSQPQAAASSPKLGEQPKRNSILRSSPTIGEVDGRRTDGGVCITLEFEKNPEHRNCNNNDKVYVAAICASRGEAMLSLPVYRRMRSITVPLPESWDGEEVHLYGFVQDYAGRCSESVYISLQGDGLNTADAVEGGADDATGVAGALAAGVESGELGMLKGDLVAGDTHRRRRAALDG